MGYRKDPDRVHPAIPGLVEQLEQHKLDRREFLRTVTLLGMAAPLAYSIAAKVSGESLIGEAKADAEKRRCAEDRRPRSGAGQSGDVLVDL